MSHPVTDLRAQPDEAAERVDQAQSGERLTILGESNGWAYVQGEDLYLGWVDRRHIRMETDPSRELLVARHGAPVRRDPRDESEVIGEVGPGIACGRVDGGFAFCGAGWVAVADTIPDDRLPQRSPTPDDIVTTAGSFLGVPYLWGGTSAHGIDCSGLTQRVYRLNGVGLDRDADQQALAGRPVDRARPGDLFFFGDERVTHTAIATGETTFIHAPRAGLTVQHGELGADRSRLRAVRRYLP